MADQFTAKLENKREKSIGKSKVVKERAKEWEEVNKAKGGKAKAKMSMADVLAVEDDEGHESDEAQWEDVGEVLDGLHISGNETTDAATASASSRLDTAMQSAQATLAVQLADDDDI